jgi:hypothetical protein
MDRFEIRGNREVEVSDKKFSDPPGMSARKREMGLFWKCSARHLTDSSGKPYPKGL